MDGVLIHANGWLKLCVEYLRAALCAEVYAVQHAVRDVVRAAPTHSRTLAWHGAGVKIAQRTETSCPGGSLYRHSQT
jgi:hypothetical protein